MYQQRISQAPIDDDKRLRKSTASTDAGSRRASSCSYESIESIFDMGSFEPCVPYRGAGIANRYQINMTEIGSGGYGKIFLAKDRQCEGRVVAIKKVLGLEESTTAKYMREAEIMQDLDHPSICKLFEVYQDGDVLYMVLECLHGGDLFDKIKDSEQQRISEETVADIIKQVACALKYAHARGIAHRDLKPENICFCNKGSTQVKVIDWGLGSDFTYSTMKSSVGSPTYSAPEVHSAQGEFEYTSSCDLWSLGVLTYVMICGKPPFWGSPKKQMEKMMAEKYPMGLPDWEAVSESAKDFIRRLLKAQPEQRMTMEEVLAHPFLTGVQDNQVEQPVLQRVLSNMVAYINAPRLFALLVASAARQLDHSDEDVNRKIFNMMDANHDGFLELQEVETAFKANFGEDSQEVSNIQRIFNKLDLDGRGRLTYTEFCAAAMQEDDRIKDQSIRLAFNAFDVQHESGTISELDVMNFLARRDANDSLPKVVYETVARDIMETYDQNYDGHLDLWEFAQMMRSFAKPDVAHCGVAPEKETETSISQIGDKLEGPHRCFLGSSPVTEAPATPEKQRSSPRTWASKISHMLLSRK
jgi:calcium-dependent protein kinase